MVFNKQTENIFKQTALAVKNFKYFTNEKFIFFLFLLVLLSSCNKDANNFQNDQRFSIFKKSFSDISNFISYENIQSYKEEGLKNTNSDGNNLFYTFPLMNGNDVFGRFYGYDNGEESIYIDFSNFTACMADCGI